MDVFLPLAVSFAATALAVPAVIKIAPRFKLVDDPKKHIHPAIIHTKIIPRAGGLAIFIGMALAIVTTIPTSKASVGILGGLTISAVTGILDDRFDLSPYVRLLANFAAGAAIVAGGIGISFIGSPFGGVIRLDQIVLHFNLAGPHTVVVLADIFALLWIVWVANMLNWSKGVDGQMPGIAAVAALVLAIASLRFLPSDPSQLSTIKLSLAAAGSAIGFLIYNWHPAKIFPGYSGSTVLGVAIATASIMSGAKIATAILVMAIPMIDGIFTIGRRALSGRSPFLGDRGHLQHRLLDLGWNQRKIALFYWGVCAILGLTALTLHSFEKLLGATIVIVWVSGGILAVSLLSQKKEK